MSCVKHYALYGAAEGGRDYNTTDMSRVRMYNEYFPPYKAAVEAGVGSVMVSFNEIDGIPASANKWLVEEVLRKQWKFNGFVVSDYTGIPDSAQIRYELRHLIIDAVNRMVNEGKDKYTIRTRGFKVEVNRYWDTEKLFITVSFEIAWSDNFG